MAVNRVDERIALVHERNAVFLEERDLEREDYEQPVHVLPELTVPPLPGCPGLRRYVVEDPETGVVREARYLEIESRVVDEDHGVRAPGGYVGLAGPDIAQQAPGLEEHVADAHHRTLAVMAHERAAPRPRFRCGRGHQVAAPEAHFGLRIPGVQPLHQVRPVKVAGRLARDDIVFHVRNRPRSPTRASARTGRGRYCQDCVPSP